MEDKDIVVVFLVVGFVASVAGLFVVLGLLSNTRYRATKKINKLKKRANLNSHQLLLSELPRVGEHEKIQKVVSRFMNQGDFNEAKNGLPMLLCLVFKKRYDVVTEMLDQGADPNVATTGGITCYFALKNNSDESISKQQLMSRFIRANVDRDAKPTMYINHEVKTACDAGQFLVAEDLISKLSQ